MNLPLLYPEFVHFFTFSTVVSSPMRIREFVYVRPFRVCIYMVCTGSLILCCVSCICLAVVVMMNKVCKSKMPITLDYILLGYPVLCTYSIRLFILFQLSTVHSTQIKKQFLQLIFTQFSHNKLKIIKDFLKIISVWFSGL